MKARKLTRTEALEWARDGRLREASNQGMVLVQSPESGDYELIHWTGSSSRDPGGQAGRVYAIKDGLEKLKADLPPLIKRTPQQRVESFVLRILEQTMQSGQIPGLDDEAIKGITQEAWRSGMPVTGEMVQRVVAHFLQDAERKQEEHDSHFVTRPR